MKVELKNLAKSEVEITITVPNDIYLKWEKKAFEELAKQVKVDGFREGNIPEDVIRKNVKQEAIDATTLDFLLPATYAEVIKQNNIQVIAQPKIDIKSKVEKEGDDFVYVATVATMPEVKVGKWDKIKVKKEEAKVEKKQVDETIQMILDRNAKWDDKDGKAEDGDRVTIDFDGFDSDGNAIENTSSKGHPLVLGSKMMVPGFEDALLGASKGDDVEFEVTFPKDYHAESMQNKKVTFKTKVQNVESQEKQELTPELIKQLTGEEKSVDDFKAMVEGDLKREVENRLDQQHYGAVVQEVIKITKAELPDALIEQELGLIIQEEQQRVAQQGLTWEQYLKHISKTEEEFKEELKKPAEDRLLARLGVQAIIKEAKIEISDEDVMSKIDELVSNYPAEHKEKAKEYYAKGSDAYRNMKYGMAADKLIDMLTK